MWAWSQCWGTAVLLLHPVFPVHPRSVSHAHLCIQARWVARNDFNKFTVLLVKYVSTKHHCQRLWMFYKLSLKKFLNCCKLTKPCPTKLSVTVKHTSLLNAHKEQYFIWLYYNIMNSVLLRYILHINDILCCLHQCLKRPCQKCISLIKDSATCLNVHISIEETKSAAQSQCELHISTGKSYGIQQNFRLILMLQAVSYAEQFWGS